MSVRGELVCDRCLVMAPGVVKLDGPLPDGWLPVGRQEHACPGCTTREEQRRHEELLDAVERAIAEIRRAK